MLLCKCVPVLTLDVLQIAEDPKYARRLTNLAKSGYFSAVLYFMLYSRQNAASCFLASRFHSCNWIRPKHSSPLQLAWSRLLVDQQREACYLGGEFVNKASNAFR